MSIQILALNYARTLVKAERMTIVIGRVTGENNMNNFVYELYDGGLQVG